MTTSKLSTGRFGDPEFLAVTPPVRGRKQPESFYRLLGVADTPRRQEYLGSWRSTYATIDEFRTNAEIRWSKSIEQYDRLACHHHPQSQRVRVTTIDRLEEIVGEGLMRRTATALANVLARQEEPFGTDDESYCQAQSHGGSTPRKRLPGLQAWLLENTPWIPIRTFDGSGVLATPAGAWLVDGRGETDRLLPRAQLRSEVGRALGLPTPTHPTTDALRSSCVHSRPAFPCSRTLRTL